MTKFRIKSPAGQSYDIEAPDGATPEQVNAFVNEHVIKAAQAPAAAPTGPVGNGSAKDGGVMSGIGKGITDAVDAGAQLLRRAVPESVGTAVDNFGNKLADLGLPVARSNGVEGVDKLVQQRNADYEASRKLAGREGIDFARIAGNVINPVNYVIPVGGAASLAGIAGRSAAQGAVSGALTPVTDGGDFAGEKAGQVGLGAILGGALGVGIQKLAQGVGNIVQKFKGPPAAADIDAAIAQAAKEQGIDLAKVPPEALNSVRANYAQSLDPKAALRMAEGEAVLGKEANLTVGQATRRPDLYTQEANLAKSGANGGAGAPLMERQAAQNTALLNSLNSAGANKAQGTYDAGSSIINSLKSADEQAASKVSSLYDKAKGLNAGDVPLDHRAFADNAMKALDKSNVGYFLPGEIKTILNDVSSGNVPLTINTSQQIKTVLATAARDAKDGNAKMAINAVRDALENAPAAGKLGTDANAAFVAARESAKQRFSDINNNPALKAVVDGVEPDKFFQKYVVNGNAADIGKIVKTAPESADVMKSQIVNFLKDKATGGANDEVAKFSQSAYNKALAGLGENKLAQVFTAAELEQLKRIGRVASYAQAQPAGSAVNNSNTASALLNKLVDKIPTVGPAFNILRNSANDIKDKAFVKNALSGKLPAASVPKDPGRINPLLNPGSMPAIYVGSSE